MLNRVLHNNYDSAKMLPNTIPFDVDGEIWSNDGPRMILVDETGEACDWDAIVNYSTIPVIYALVHSPTDKAHPNVRSLEYVDNVYALSQPVSRGEYKGYMSVMKNSAPRLPMETPYHFAEIASIPFTPVSELPKEELLLVPNYSYSLAPATTWTHTIPLDNVDGAAAGLVTANGRSRYKFMVMRSPRGIISCGNLRRCIPYPSVHLEAASLPSGSMYYNSPLETPVALSGDGQIIYFLGFRIGGGSSSLTPCFVPSNDPYSSVDRLNNAFLLTVGLYSLN